MLPDPAADVDEGNLNVGRAQFEQATTLDDANFTIKVLALQNQRLRLDWVKLKSHLLRRIDTLEQALKVARDENEDVKSAKDETITNMRAEFQDFSLQAEKMHAQFMSKDESYRRSKERER